MSAAFDDFPGNEQNTDPTEMSTSKESVAKNKPNLNMDCKST